VEEQPDGSAALRVAVHSGNEGCATDRLRDAVIHGQEADRQLEDAVLHARLIHGLTWEAVAGELHISRQAVTKRYAVAEMIAEQVLQAEEAAER
jgi:hypothetical protein